MLWSQYVKDNVECGMLNSTAAVPVLLQYSYIVGQIIRMVCKGKYYRRPVPYKSPEANDITVSVLLYNKTDSTLEGNIVFVKNKLYHIK